YRHLECLRGGRGVSRGHDVDLPFPGAVPRLRYSVTWREDSCDTCGEPHQRTRTGGTGRDVDLFGGGVHLQARGISLESADAKIALHPHAATPLPLHGGGTHQFSVDVMPELARRPARGAGFHHELMQPPLPITERAAGARRVRPFLAHDE